MAALAGSAGGSPQQVGTSEDQGKSGFLAKLLKPLRDFGFGSMSFWEGGVGLFIFAGIGEAQSKLPNHKVLKRPI